MPRNLKVVSINPDAKAVLPDGRVATREDILKALNLNPGTTKESWLNVAACNKNAAALKPEDAINLLKKGLIDEHNVDIQQLNEIKKINKPIR